MHAEEIQAASEKDEDSMISFVMESFANVDGRGIQEQRYTDRSWRRLFQGPQWRLTTTCHGYIIVDNNAEVRDAS